MKRKRFLFWYDGLFTVLFWAVIFILPFLIRLTTASGDSHNAPVTHLLVFYACLIFVFYLHTYVLYPMKSGKYGLILYALCMAGCFVLTIFIADILPIHGTGHTGSSPWGLNGSNGKPNWFAPFFSFLLVIFCSYCYRLYTNKIRQDIRIRDMETINLKTELDFLRSQISPHFLFNLMNTLVSMARKKSELLEPSLVSLSQMLRYMLYDIEDKQINLEKELEYLNSYTNLQLLRFGDRIRFNLFVSGDFEGFKIEPMLLIPFLENAFKHGTEQLAEPIIDVVIKMDSNKRLLYLLVLNSIGIAGQQAESPSGIGLNNISRRLELLYPEKHHLTINRKDEQFTVTLEIYL